MSDESVKAALRTDSPLVVVEAPAGCGKTHQGADYAKDQVGVGSGERLLILTHTHAACAVFASRTHGMASSRIEIATIDSLIVNIAVAYHSGLGLPADVVEWVRQRKDGYGALAVRVAALLRRHPMVAAAAARRYPVIICDEHQDSNGDQHAIVMALAAAGSRLRIFTDPMQQIIPDKPAAGGSHRYDWEGLKKSAHTFERLEFPHRWKTGCPELGQWTLQARDTLMSGGRIDLRAGLPKSVSVVFAENQAQANLDFRLDKNARKPVDAFHRAQASLLLLTRHNQTARAIRAMFFRQLPIWEGHTRQGLERLVNSLEQHQGDAAAIATAMVQFMDATGKGFSPSSFGNRLVLEVQQGCAKRATGKPAMIQELARLLLAEPDYRGASKMLARLNELREQQGAFSSIEIDHQKEFWEAIRLGNFESARVGLAEITHRRTYTRPQPPLRAISTIHKAKGLETGSVIVMPCDGKTFPDKQDARCLLYVALSRATKRLQLVVSRANPSPLLVV